MNQWSGEFLRKGLKVLLNAKMTKVKTKDLVDDELLAAQADAMTIAQKNLDDLVAGKLTKRGSGSAATKGVDAKVKTEAMRLARNTIKDTIRKNGGIISHTEPAVITAAAKQVVETDPSYIAQATENLEERAVKPAVAIDLSALGVVESPKLKAKADLAKAARKASPTLSKTQAGQVAPRPAGPNHPQRSTNLARSNLARIVRHQPHVAPIRVDNAPPRSVTMAVN